MIVPGTFGFEEEISNISIMSHELQDHFVVSLLQGFGQIGVHDTRVAGFCPWHFNECIGPAYCTGRGLGAVNFNRTTAMLRRMREAIIATARKTDDEPPKWLHPAAPPRRVMNDSWAAARGFSYQPYFPSVGGTGVEIWGSPLAFNLSSIAEDFRVAKEFFPGLTTLRLWMSLDGFISNPASYGSQLESVLALGPPHGLRFVITLFNWWHSTPDWGGYSLLALSNNPTVSSYHMLPPAAARRTASSKREPRARTDGWESHAAAADFLEAVVLPNRQHPAVALWDVGNEPRGGPNVQPPGPHTAAVQHFINMTALWLRTVAKVSAPIGISAGCGTHAGTYECLQTWNGFRPDVLLVHPYCQHCFPGPGNSTPTNAAQYRLNLDDAVRLANELHVPLLATEACWGEMDDQKRALSCEFEMQELQSRGIGISPHALRFSKVADLHDWSGGPVGPPGYMAFIGKERALRPYHDFPLKYGYNKSAIKTPIKTDTGAAHVALVRSRSHSVGRCVYTLSLRGGTPANHTTGAPRVRGERFDHSASRLLSHLEFGGSDDPLHACEENCTSDPRCVGLSLTTDGGADCYTVNETKSVATWLDGASYLCRPPPTTPAPVSFPIRGWSVSCDLPTASGGMDLYPVNLLTEGAPPTALASLARQGVGVLAYRDLAQPFEARYRSSACRTGNHTKCIDAVADMFHTVKEDAPGTPWEHWSGIALDEWTTANRTDWPSTDPWGAPNALANLAAGCREGRRRYPRTFAAGWVSRPDDTFAQLMRDGTLDLAMVEGYSVCWLPNHCSSTIEGYFSRLKWARSAGFINRTVFAFGWMVPEDAAGPFKPPLNASHPTIPQRCDQIGCDNPNGWTLSKLRASMLRLRAAFPEMPGVLGWGGNRGGCGNASRAFIRGASKLMAELWPNSAAERSDGALKSDDTTTTLRAPVDLVPSVRLKADDLAVVGLHFSPPVLVSSSTGDCPGTNCRKTFFEAKSDLFAELGTDGRHFMGTFGGPGLAHDTGVNPLFLYSNSFGRHWQLAKLAHGVEPWERNGGELIDLGGGRLQNWGGLASGGVAPPGPNVSSRRISAPTTTVYQVTDGDLTASTSKQWPISEGLSPSSFNISFGRGNDFTGPEALRLPDGAWLASFVLIWAHTSGVSSPHHAPRLSVAAFRSTDDLHWLYSSVIANATDFPWSVYGPQENDLALLSDGKTITCMLRMDGPCLYRDEPGLYCSFYQTFSTNTGVSWSGARPVPETGCVRPRLLQLSSPRVTAPLLLAGGRLCTENTSGLFVWSNADGMSGFGQPLSGGDAVWTRHSVSYWHNRLAPEVWRSNLTLMFSPSVNDSSAFETQAYMSLVHAGPGRAALFYQKFRNPHGPTVWPSDTFMTVLTDYARSPPANKPQSAKKMIQKYVIIETAKMQAAEAGDVARHFKKVYIYKSDDTPHPRLEAIWMEPQRLLYGHPKLPDAEWVRGRVDEMHALGFETIILAYVELVCFGGGVFYKGSALPWLKGLPQLDFDVVGEIMAAANKNKQRVILGLGRGPAGPLVFTNRTMVEGAIQTSLAVAEELIARFESHRSLYGFYLSDEANDFGAAMPFYNSVCSRVAAMTTRRRLYCMVAPAGSPTGLNGTVLASSAVDIYSYQDAVGAGYCSPPASTGCKPYTYTWNPQSRIADLAHDFETYATWHAESTALGHPKQIWAGTELWQMSGPTYAKPFAARFARVSRQMSSVNTSVDVLGGYEYLGFMQSQAAAESEVNVSTGDGAQRLFNGYSSYLHGRKTDDTPDLMTTERTVSGWTGFKSCGDAMCVNMSHQIAQIVSHADIIDTVIPYVGGAAPQYNQNHSACYNDTQPLAGEPDSFFPWAAFRFGVGPGHLGPSEGDGSGRYICIPSPDSLVTAWAKPLRAAGVSIMPIIDGGATIWPVAGRDEGFFAAAVTIAEKFGFAGWSLDVEPTVNQTAIPSGAEQLALYAQFLTTFSQRLTAHGLRLSTAEPNGNLMDTADITPMVANVSNYSAVGRSGAEVATMSTYYGVMPVADPALPGFSKNHLRDSIVEWQKIVPTAALTIGFGSLYAAWGDKTCGPSACATWNKYPDGSESCVNQTSCLAKSLGVVIELDIRSVALFEINAWGCGNDTKWYDGGSTMCQIAGPWPPESWWSLLRDFVKPPALKTDDTLAHDDGLTSMLHIDWKRLPDRPLGTQDSAAGVLDGDFVVVLGNRGIEGTPAHVGQGGMWNGGHALPITNPTQGWRDVAEVPSWTRDGHDRLGMSMGTTTTVTLPDGAGPALAFVGGFSHTNCSRKAFIMRKSGTNFSYEHLPPLPWDIAEADLVAVGSKLFSIGGSDCGIFPYTERFLTWSDRWGGNFGFGQRVLTLDLADCPQWHRTGGEGVSCEWKHQVDFPGTPRAGSTVVSIGEMVYLLGGYSSANNSIPPPKPAVKCTSLSQPGCLSSPVDNWQLNTTSMQWTELPSRLDSSTHPAGDTKGFGVWRGRYIVSVGVIGRGHSLLYPAVAFGPIAQDSVLKTNTLNSSCSPPLKGWGPNNSYPNTISVYDTQTHRFGVVTTSSKTEPGLVKPGCPPGLPLNCFSPAMALVGNELFVTGGECDPHTVPSNAKHGGLPHAEYWHYPRITLHGQLSEPLATQWLKMDDVESLADVSTAETARPGFLGVYHPPTPRMSVWMGQGVANGSTVQGAFRFGTVAISNKESYYEDATLRGSIAGYCSKFNANAVWGILDPPSEGGTLTKPRNTLLWEPHSPAGLVQGAARWSQIARQCPQVAGVIIDDFVQNYAGTRSYSPPRPPRNVSCPASSPFKYLSALSTSESQAVFCCPVPTNQSAGCAGHKPCCWYAGTEAACQGVPHCSNFNDGCLKCPPNAPFRAGGRYQICTFCCPVDMATTGHCPANECCLTPGLEHSPGHLGDGCQGVLRCPGESNPENRSACGVTPPHAMLSVDDIREIKAALMGKVVGPVTGAVDHVSAAMTPHLRLGAVWYAADTARYNGVIDNTKLFAADTVDAALVFLWGQSVPTPGFADELARVRTSVGKHVELMAGVYLSNSGSAPGCDCKLELDNSGHQTCRHFCSVEGVHSVLKDTIELYDAGELSSAFLFEGDMLSASFMNQSVWDMFKLPETLGAEYYPYLGEATVEVTAGGAPLAGALVTVRRKGMPLTSKLTSVAGTVTFGGWTGKAPQPPVPVPHTIIVAKAGYRSTNTTLQVVAGESHVKVSLDRFPAPTPPTPPPMPTPSTGRPGGCAGHLLSSCWANNTCDPSPLHPNTVLMPSGLRSQTNTSRRYCFRTPVVLGPFPPHSDAILAFAEARDQYTCGDQGEHALALIRSTYQGVTWPTGDTSCSCSGSTCSCTGTSGVCYPFDDVYNISGAFFQMDGFNIGAAVFDNITRNVHFVFTECADDFGHGACGPTSSLLLISSRDYFGETWGAVSNLTSTMVAGGFTSAIIGPGKGMQLPSGRLVIPAHGPRLGQKNDVDFNAAVMYSDDHAVTWKFGNMVPNPSHAKPDENMAAVLPDSTVVLAVRDSMAGNHSAAQPNRLFASSTDGGETFSELMLNPMLEGPVCQGSLLAVGDVLFFSHPFDAVARANGWIKFSTDVCPKCWWMWRQVTSGPFGYSSLSLIDRNDTHASLGVLYETCGATCDVHWTIVTYFLPQATSSPISLKTDDIAFAAEEEQTTPTIVATVSATGSIDITLGALRLAVSSTFTESGPLLRALGTAVDAPLPLSPWPTPVAVKDEARGTWLVSAAAGSYRLNRTVRVEGHFVRIKDQLTTAGSSGGPPVGIEILHRTSFVNSEIKMEGAVLPSASSNWACHSIRDEEATAAGDRTPDTASGNPTIHAHGSLGGAGMIPLDDVFETHHYGNVSAFHTAKLPVQSDPPAWRRKSNVCGNHHPNPPPCVCTVTNPPSLSLVDQNLVLPAGGEVYTQEWAVYPLPASCPDYYCFINSVRQDLKVDAITIPGTGLLSMSPEYWEMGPPAGFTSHDGDWARWSDAQLEQFYERESMHFVIAGVSQLSTGTVHRLLTPDGAGSAKMDRHGLCVDHPGHPSPNATPPILVRQVSSTLPTSS
jgi:hypothetical protein